MPGPDTTQLEPAALPIVHAMELVSPMLTRAGNADIEAVEVVGHTAA